MSVTLATFHAEMSLLNALAEENMYDILVTLATFHAEMSELNDVFD